MSEIQPEGTGNPEREFRRSEQETDYRIKPASGGCSFIVTFLQVIVPIAVLVISTASLHDANDGGCPVLGRTSVEDSVPLARCIYIWVVSGVSLVIALLCFMVRYMVRSETCLGSKFITVSVDIVLGVLWGAVAVVLIQHASTVPSDATYPHKGERVAVIVLSCVLVLVQCADVVRTLVNRRFGDNESELPDDVIRGGDAMGQPASIVA